MFKNFKSKKIIFVISISFFIVNAFAIGITSLFLYNSKEHYRLEAIQYSQGYSEILSNNIFNSFEKIDIIFNNVSNLSNSHNLNSLLTQQTTLYPYLKDISVVNYSGNIIGTSNSNQDYYINTYKSILNKGSLTNRNNIFIFSYNDKQKNILVFAKTLNDTNIIFASTNLNYFVNNLKSISVGEHGSIFLIDSNKNIVFNSKDINLEDSLSTLKNIPISNFTTIHNGDIYTFKKIKDYNYYININLSKDDYLIQWYHQRYEFIFFYCFFIVIFLIFSASLYFLWKTESQKENRLATLLHSTTDGIYGINKEGFCTFCNSKALELLGYSNHEIIGTKINNLILKDSHLINQNQSTVEIEIIKKDGTSFFAEIWKHKQIQDDDSTSFIFNFTDITNKRNTDLIVWKQANFDSLTLVPNRSYFEEKLQQNIDLYNTSHKEFALLFIDLDNFKDINDNFGHHAGDDLLIQVTQRLQSCLSKNDIVARLGGDEFTIILNDYQNKMHIEKICSLIIAEIEKPFVINNHVCYIGSSIGITLFPEDANTLEKLLQNADKAMYVSKESGKNTFNFFSKDLDLIIMKRLEMSNDLILAIEENQFELFIQPIVNTKTKKIIKGEVLLRWKHPTKGYISPAEFIPVSEKNGMINYIGEFVFKKSANWLKQFINDNPEHNDFQISINVSPIQFLSPNFIETVKSHLTFLNLPKNSIILEITEGILLDTNSNIYDKFNDLKDIGVKIAIDDFGTGYSAMSYLHKFDFDFIKIDQSFICNLKKDKNKKITKSLVSMAQNLGIEVIAEGVETEEQANFLTEIECDFLQGYLYSKPIPFSNLKF